MICYFYSTGERSTHLISGMMCIHRFYFLFYILRYKQRAVELYKKLCELGNEDADTYRIINMKLRFNKSKHECINKAIRRRYKNNDVFPTYYDIDKLIRKCVKRNKLKISNIELEIESE